MAIVFLFTIYHLLFTSVSSSFPQLDNAASCDPAAKGEQATLACALAEDRVEQIKYHSSRHRSPDQLERGPLDEGKIRRLAEHSMQEQIHTIVQQGRTC